MFYRVIILVATLLLSFSANANLVIIANKNFSENLDKEYVKRIFLGKEQLLPSGSKIMILEMDNESDTFAEFANSVVEKQPERYKAYMARQIFTGKMPPLQRVGSSAEMKELVSKDNYTIGYILKSEVDNTVKVILSF
ncbi:hypothetical protein HG263_15730 [Pseudoalteromonas sp. JBTF-M23]|uniref:Phosphate ABC transporter substrate-binding protein n=1 Tax=Pseudoalteromonas caenipelagi TaxID=2726988 RepID=A0A849VHN5_9GAMM|nr:hypothetical protein [Pseudoalteromonas caenipelagi]NOU51983.1 hypothetical protein [Pseudoalteromonas caenipelagi]